MHVNECLRDFAQEFPNCLCDKDAHGSHAPGCPLDRLRRASEEVSNHAFQHFRSRQSSPKEIAEHMEMRSKGGV